MSVTFNVSGADPGTTAAGATGGAGTLSFAVAQINAMPASGGPYVINLTDDVTLSGPVSPILGSVTSNGNGHTNTATGTNRILFVGTDTASQTAYASSILGQRPQVAIDDVTLANGTAQGGAGGWAAAAASAPAARCS